MRAPGKPGGTVRNARRLRRAMSSAEVKLWCELRAGPAGMRFRRQHPAGMHVLDFYCAAARLAVEVDGEAHDRGDRSARDGKRDEWLARHGVATLRVPARELYRDLDAVIRWIVAEARSRLSLHHPALPDGSPPHARHGED